MQVLRKPRVELPEKHLPLHWKEHLIANQLKGGVYLVFLEGKNQKEIEDKCVK